MSGFNRFSYKMVDVFYKLIIAVVIVFVSALLCVLGLAYVKSQGVGFMEMVVGVLCFIHFSRNYVSASYFKNFQDATQLNDKPIKIRR